MFRFEWVQALILGVIQGLTEFLPISSSAHLIILPWSLQWEPFGLTFDLAVHFGTLLSLFVYFRRDIYGLFSEIRGVREGDFINSNTMHLAIGSMPIAIFGFIAFQLGVEGLRSPIVTAGNLFLFGFFLWLADHFGDKTRRLGSIGRWDALLIGLGQALAIMPGVSRSGITITIALLIGFRRPDSARFAFLLGIPAISMAVMGKIPGFLAGDAKYSVEISILLLGIVTSFITGLICIQSLLRFLQNQSMTVFFFYRALMAAVIFGAILLGGGYG